MSWEVWEGSGRKEWAGVGRHLPANHGRADQDSLENVALLFCPFFLSSFSLPSLASRRQSAASLHRFVPLFSFASGDSSFPFLVPQRLLNFESLVGFYRVSGNPRWVVQFPTFFFFLLFFRLLHRLSRDVTWDIERLQAGGAITCLCFQDDQFRGFLSKSYDASTLQEVCP